MPDVLSNIADHADTIAKFIGYASVLAAATKTKYDNIALNFISVVINFIAFNFKKYLFLSFELLNK